jgi:hypothetical protein
MEEKREQKFDKKKPFKRRTPKKERVVIGENDFLRREKLLKNAEYELGKVEQRGKHLLYTVGNEDFGFVEYLIVNAKLPKVVETKNDSG